MGIVDSFYLQFATRPFDARFPASFPQKRRGLHAMALLKRSKNLNVSIHTDLPVRVDDGMYMHAKAVY